MNKTEETAEEIVERITNGVRGKKFTKIPIWSIFAGHIAYTNRFMDSEIKRDVCAYIDHILSRKEMLCHFSKGTVIYRARKILKTEITKKADGLFEGFNAEKSGMPPYRKTPNGRVNIAGIPILYTAMEKETACAELRPMKNDFISIAEYKLKEDINVANFLIENVDSVKGKVEGECFLKGLFESFSLPISNDLIDYLPSEFISEYIRLNHTDLAGIRYSSLHNLGGYNIALFSEDNVEFIKSTVVQCNRVEYTYKEV